jgi:cullin 2
MRQSTIPIKKHYTYSVARTNQKCMEILLVIRHSNLLAQYACKLLYVYVIVQVSEMEVSEYMQEVVETMKTARRRGQRFLHPTSITKFTRECEARLVEDYQNSYLYSQLQPMVQEERRQDLKNIFHLLNGIPRALDPLLDKFEERIKSQGLAAVRPWNTGKDKATSGNVVEFMGAVMGVHSHYHQLISDLFSSHKLFFSALDRACRVFVNAQENHTHQPRAPILLAKYCDQLLRKSSKGVGEQEVEDRLEEVITVFRYLDDKDVFQRFYSRMLARRLMQSLSVSMEMEEGMIQRLKHACGFEYVARLQRMVVDMKLSEDCMASFQEHLSLSSSSLPLAFTTLVLQSAAWPFSKPTGNFNVPPQMLSVIEKFERFYETKYTGRKLSWLYHMSLGDLRLNYLKKQYTVSATTHQMALLLAFNSSEQHSFSSLLLQCGLDNKEMTFTLQSLLTSKLLILQDEETTLHSADCMVCLNKNYSNKRTKFKITAALQKDTQQEVEQTQTAVQEDRKMHIQAAIVRVMKARKSLKHNQLIEETIQQVKTRFTPSVPMIKKCIEVLMDRQYLERQENARDTYDYIA